MSELTREKKCQIAALGAKGKTVEEIAQTAGIDVETVREFLSARSSEKKPLFGGNKKITTKTIAKINELRQQGKTHKEIADELGIGTATVNRYLHKDKPAQINEDFDQAVDEMIAETKKEPAPAATDTDSMKNEIKHISTTSNDNTETAESQALNGVDFIGLFEGMLHEGYGNKAKIVKVAADTEKASIVFEYEGKAYGLNFGLAF